jgi:hypothetical protein
MLLENINGRTPSVRTLPIVLDKVRYLCVLSTKVRTCNEEASLEDPCSQTRAIISRFHL